MSSIFRKEKFTGIFSALLIFFALILSLCNNEVRMTEGKAPISQSNDMTYCDELSCVYAGDIGEITTHSLSYDNIFFHHSNNLILVNKKAGTKCTGRTLIFLIFIGLCAAVSVLNASIYCFIRNYCTVRNFCSARITRYIHFKDGKKPRLFN